MFYNYQLKLQNQVKEIDQVFFSNVRKIKIKKHFISTISSVKKTKGKPTTGKCG